MESKTLYKISDLNEEEIVIVEIPPCAEVHANRIMFTENMISKIQIFKWKNSSKEESSVFVEFYLGNMEIGSIVTNKDFIVAIEKGATRSYYKIREAMHYDYL
jgi:hypothetical protein